MQTNIDDVKNELAPLYCRYSGQCYPQDAFCNIYPETQNVTFEYYAEIGNSYPYMVFMGRMYRIKVSCYLSGKQIEGILTDPKFEALINIVIEEYSVNTLSSKGRLTDEGELALIELSDMLCNIEGGVRVYSPEEWIEWPHINFYTSDEEIDKYADQIINDAKAENVIIDGDVNLYLKDLRNRMKGE